ncbi:MAG TPA: TonB-dependent receptor [Rhodocyclaceae bacterium]|nr:TonB-dependent receptor [Rhodocyclaceae bacterium]
MITAADIAREKPSDIVEMLKSRVGLDENNSVITMRGVKGIAIFVDGFASSMTELAALKPEQVERIEVLRGAASARFGAEAMGGAIAVTTRGVAGDLRGGFVQGLDSRAGHFSRLSGGREADGFGWSLLAEDRVSEGFRSVPDSPFPYQVTVMDERSKSRAADGKLAWRSQDVDLSVNMKRVDLWSFFGRPAWAFDSRTDDARMQLAWRIADGVATEVAVGEEHYDTAGVRDRGTGTDAEGLAPERWLTQSYRQREATAALTWATVDWRLHLGVNLDELSEDFGAADYATRQVQSITESLIRKEALFVSTEGPLGAGHLEWGLRRDFQRYVSARIFEAGPPAQTVTGSGVSKSASSPKVALSWPVGGYRVRGSIGTGFSPPQGGQLYYSDVGAGAVTLANPALKPERSTTADLGLSHHAPSGDWSTTLFATRWQDKIGMRIVDYGTPVIQQPQNTGRVTARGVEMQWAKKMSTSWSMSTNYTYTRTRVTEDLADPALVGKALPDMPRNKANAMLDYDSRDGFNARIKLRAVGSTFTDDANTVVDSRGYRWRKAGYAVLDLAATWRRTDWELTLALDNALNRDYVSGFFWHQQPRTLRGELSLRF